MRIRKRQIPLPLSSLSTISISDPHFDSSSVVQLHHGHDPQQNLSKQADASCCQPSDHHQNQWIGIGSSSSSLDQKGKDCLILLEEGDYNKEEDEEKTNDSSIMGEEIAAAGVLSQLSSSHSVIGRWCGGEKALFPLTKSIRKNDAEEEEEEEEIMLEEKDNNKKKKMKTKMKNNQMMNKKFNGTSEQEETMRRVDSNSSSSSTNSLKKRGRGGAIMEGSRCSRVNGRGWRCCQQTLVGYSLCEHHLGKGRIRSMNGVRRRSLGSSAASKKSTDGGKLVALSSSSSSSTLLQESNKMKQEVGLKEGNEEEDEKKPLMSAKRRMKKLGMVKARSISSLLGQKNNEIIAAD